MKKIYINESQLSVLSDELNKEVTFYEFFVNTKTFLKDLLNKPYEAKEVFGEKDYKDGLKSVEYFEKDKDIFNYFQNAKAPNFLEAKEASKNIKSYKEYEKALKHYNRLKDTKDGKGLTLVGKW